MFGETKGPVTLFMNLSKGMIFFKVPNHKHDMWTKTFIFITYLPNTYAMYICTY